MAKLNRRAAFRRAVNGLRKQKAFSNSESEVGIVRCLYRAPNGCKCGVGFLIPDTRYTAELEGSNAFQERVAEAVDRRLLQGDSLPLSASDLSFLAALQRDLHDDLSTNGSGKWDDLLFEEAVQNFIHAYPELKGAV